MKRSFVFVLLVVLALLFVVACDGAPVGSTASGPISQPVAQVAPQDGLVQQSEAVTEEIEWVQFTSPQLITELDKNTGYCPPGDTKIVEGMFYQCIGLTTSEWKRFSPKYFSSESALYGKLDKGQAVALYSFGAVVVTLDPIPVLDDILYFTLGSAALVAITDTTMQSQVAAPPIWTGSTAAEYDAWKAGAISASFHDEVGVDLTQESLVDAEDFPRLPPRGVFTAIIIEDSSIWAGKLVATFTAAGIRVIAVYPNCLTWAAGPVKNANVFVVDFDNDTGVFGSSCIPAIKAQIPPPIVVAGFTAEFLNEPRGDQNGSSVQELYDEAGTDFVLHKKGEEYAVARLVEEIINYLLGI